MKLVEGMVFNRLNDVFFKNLLGSPQRKDLTLDFLNSLGIGNGKIFTNINFVDKELEPSYFFGKESRLDIHGILDDNTEVDIEVQVNNFSLMAERSLYYWARMYGQQLVRGDHYQKLCPTVVISLLSYNLLSEKDFHNIYKIKNVKTHELLTDKLEIHFIELSKISISALKSKLKKLTGLESWLAYFSNRLDENEMEVLMMDNISIKKANTYEDEFLRDKQRWWAYEQKEKELRDYVDFIYDAECRTRVKAKAEGRAEGRAEGKAEGIAEGKAEGIAEGKEEGIAETLQAVAKNMHEEGFSLEVIGKAIKKDLNEVKALLKDV